MMNFDVKIKLRCHIGNFFPKDMTFFSHTKLKFMKYEHALVYYNTQVSLGKTYKDHKLTYSRPTFSMEKYLN